MGESWEDAEAFLGPQMRLSFAEWTIDQDARQLESHGQPRHISPKAFDLLDLLARSHPKALSKAQIHDVLWPETFVSEAALLTLVAEVRTVLGDDARHPRYVRTVRGFGYAFAADVGIDTPAAPAGADPRVHRLHWPKREVTLAEGRNVLGRTRKAAVWIESSSVSRQHACVHLENGAARVEDLGSKNGTWVGDRRVEEPLELQDGDVIKVGSVQLTYRVYLEGEDTLTTDR